VLQAFNASTSPNDVFAVPQPARRSLNARNTLGGTAPAQVQAARLQRHRARLG
jgi:argininosuccinate lyase